LASKFTKCRAKFRAFRKCASKQSNSSPIKNMINGKV